MVGFPHSDIRGSKIALISPRLIAECHVLHRLLSPRHPPDALNVFLILCACIILPIIHKTFVSVKSISLICSIYPSFFRMIVYHVKLKTIFKHQKNSMFNMHFLFTTSNNSSPVKTDNETFSIYQLRPKKLWWR